LAEAVKPKREEVPDACPHCGNKLSPWQQVLLATDRALVCKKCWYRIILDVIPTSTKTDSAKSKNKGSN
jgi:DNA-directed RNA polymerase subunit RPC12/RpoP